MNKKHTPGPWAWQKFGNHFQLTAQHGLREIIIGSLAVEMPMESYPAMNENGILKPINPEHPNAKRIVDCVNALEGIENPKTMRDTWELCKELELDAYYKMKEERDQLLKALQKIANQSEEIGRDGCTYGDTKYDSISVCYGINNQLKCDIKIALDALNKIKITN